MTDNKSIVGFVASCFDLFHAGHIMMLKESKQECDYLIVGLQVDPTLERPEKNRPVQSIFERFTQVDACKYVDEIVIYSTEKDLMDVLQSYPINLRIIGEEYMHKSFTGKELDIPIYYNKRKHSFSTSELRQRVMQSEKAKYESSDNNGSTLRS
jgi:glycerol-3-phosphate cytidylyltransferase